MFENHANQLFLEIKQLELDFLNDKKRSEIERNAQLRQSKKENIEKGLSNYTMATTFLDVRLIFALIFENADSEWITIIYLTGTRQRRIPYIQVKRAINFFLNC